MKKLSGKDACRLGVTLIERQLSVLPVSIAGVMEPSLLTLPSKIRAPDWEQLERRSERTVTGIERKIGSGYSIMNSLRELHDEFNVDHGSKTFYLEIIIGNALLAVGTFFQAHDMATLLTPEIQFLGHVCDAISNGNIITIAEGFVPDARFEGLVIDSASDGAPLFDSEETSGLMTFGDSVALLHWLAGYLRGAQNLVTGGDAG